MRKYLYKYMLFLVGMWASLSCLPSYQTVHTEATVRDSLMISHRFIDKTVYRDSIFERLRNDTLYIYKERLVDHYIFTGDTVYVNRTDSVSVPVPVERKLTKWEQFRMDWGGRFMMVSIVLVCVAVFMLFRPRGRI